MNTFYKKTLAVLFLTISVFFINIGFVDASSLDRNYVTFECIYSDGSLFAVSWSPGSQEGYWRYSVNRDTYNVKNSDTQKTISSGSIIYVNMTSSVNLDNFKCANYVRIGNVRDGDDDDDPVISFVKFAGTEEGTKFEDSEINVGDSWFLWFKTGDGAEKANKNSVAGKLLSDRITIDDQAGTPDKTLYFKEYDPEKAAKSSYVMVHKYGGVTVLEAADEATVIDESFSTLEGLSEGDSIYLNDPSKKTVTLSSGNSYYDFAAPRYKVCTSSTSECTRQYIKVPAIDDDGGEVDTGKLCDEIMPETAKVLKRVIGVLQLLVPLFLIVLTGLDLAKIVFSGKLEDEIPKMRKRIIIRFIVAAAFFFAPLLVNLVIRMMQSAGGTNTGLIEQIGCLFE